MQIKTEFVENRSVRILGIEFYSLHWIVILQLFRIYDRISCFFFAFSFSFKRNVRANSKKYNDELTTRMSYYINNDKTTESKEYLFPLPLAIPRRFRGFQTASYFPHFSHTKVG